MVGYLVTFEGYADAIAEMEEEDEEEDEGMTAEQKGMYSFIIWKLLWHLSPAGNIDADRSSTPQRR